MPFLGSRELIGQAVANLLDNSLKYGAPVGPAAIQDAAPRHPVDETEFLVALRRTPEREEIVVADHGRGVAPADRSRALNRFVRLEGARSRPGSGLGLSLAAAVAHLHGGEIRLEDNEPGLRVVIALPLTPRGAVS